MKKELTRFLLPGKLFFRVCPENGKDPLLGRVDGFQIGSKIKVFNQEIVSDRP